jgi:hypothetical protein
MGQSQDPSRNEDEKLKVKCESAKSRVQEGDVGEERFIYAGGRDRHDGIDAVGGGAKL